MYRGEPGVTGVAAPRPVMEELKKKAGAASLHFKKIVRGKLISPGSVTTRNVRYLYDYIHIGEFQ